jgi:hypothetical protein
MQAINRKSGEVPVCKLSEGVVWGLKWVWFLHAPRVWAP